MHFEDCLDVQNDTLLEPGGSSIYKLHKGNGEIKFNKCSSTKNLSLATWLRQCLWSFFLNFVRWYFFLSRGSRLRGTCQFYRDVSSTNTQVFAREHTHKDHSPCGIFECSFSLKFQNLPLGFSTCSLRNPVNCSWRPFI